MIMSQLLLTGFVFQWLISQYRDERGLLEKELSGFYIKSHDEVLDSLLFKTYVVPVLSKNRVIMMDHRINHSDSSGKKKFRLEYHNNVNKLNDSTKITVNIVGKKDSSGRNKALIKGKRLPDEMLLKSVKLIVAHAGDSVLKNPEMIEFSSDIDTAKFKKYFNERISGNGMKFQIRWVPGTTDLKHIQRRNVIFVEPLPEFPLPHAEVEGYNGYLVGRITTQIIFGFVLIFITALAFSTSYKSLHNHMIMNSLRDEFVSNITHELKTPVSTIMVALEALGNYNMKKEPGVIEEYLNLASGETKRLSELINRVLDQSLLEQKEHPLDLGLIDLNPLITGVVSMMSRKLGSNGKIEFKPGNETITIHADQLFIKGVLINLIDNSIKYCDKDPLIYLSAERKRNEIIIEIKDNGPGIPVEYQKRIFEKFFRLPSDNVHNVKGYGLGLSFAMLVMKLHKGNIEVRNHNPGCSFILKFPEN